MKVLRGLLWWLLALALILAPGVALFNGWISEQRWPIERLRVESDSARIDQQQISDRVQPWLTGGFFAVRPDRIRDALLTVPWVAEAQVRKRWPDLLEVRLIEHRAVARFTGGRLLSERGVLFTVPEADIDPSLPSLVGADDQAVELMAFLRESGRRLATVGLRPVEAAVNARRSWRLRLDDGTDLHLGREQPLDRLSRLIDLLPALLHAAPAPGQRPVRIDLRYADGFAVRWPQSDTAPAGTRAPSVPPASGQAGLDPRDRRDHLPVPASATAGQPATRPEAMTPHPILGTPT